MPDWLNAIILGIVEGLTEFIPVSSTAMLLLSEKVLHLSGMRWETFTILIQLGAILAVVALYFQRLWSVALRLPHDPTARRFVLSVLVAFLPAVVLGVLLHDFIKGSLFENPLVICSALIIGGVVLLILDKWHPAPMRDDAMRFPLGTSLVIGVFQCLAMIPGVSRSGATIVGAMLQRCDKRASAEFSFFLAMPTMAGAFAYDLFKSYKQLNMQDAGIIAIGFVVSFIFGAFVVKTLLDFVSRHGFAPFAWLRIVLGGIGLALVFTHVWA
ncbi:MAG TPA: undecaprenyl-diphosphate phosphatase [Caulobacteraceae bacterium]